MVSPVSVTVSVSSVSSVSVQRSRENLLLLVAAAVVLSSTCTEAFGPLHVQQGRHSQLQQARSTRSRSLPFISSNSNSALFLQDSTFDFTPSFDDEDDDEDDDDDDDDDEEDEDDEIHIDPDSLGDWRTFRRNLAATPAESTGSAEGESTTSDSSSSVTAAEETVTRQEQPNEKVLKAQSEELALEYSAGVWAHETSTPEVGGLVVRLPLEAEIHRNYKHSMTGKKLRKSCTDKNMDTMTVRQWYKKAQRLVEDEMMEIADEAGDDGQVDATGLNDERAELLQLYLDNQETWQEVCLVLERSEEVGTATALVLNRPMAFKLTESVGKMVLYGTFLTKAGKSRKMEAKHTAESLMKFMLAFGQECAVYVGGPDEQDQPAEIVHGIAGLSGATEISPGSRIYRGGMDAAIDGVLRGLYSPLDFRFFVGCHIFEESTLDISVVLGKYQPIACARTLALKQCIKLPKPLWHEVLDLCGGEMAEISRLEFLKRGDVRFQIVDEDEFDDDDDDDDEDDDDEDDDDDDDDDFSLPDELDELLLTDDDEDDDDDYD